MSIFLDNKKPVGETFVPPPGPVVVVAAEHFACAPSNADKIDRRYGAHPAGVELCPHSGVRYLRHLSSVGVAEPAASGRRAGRCRHQVRGRGHRRAAGVALVGGGKHGIKEPQVGMLHALSLLCYIVIIAYPHILSSYFNIA